jgi:hypothetical protein
VCCPWCTHTTPACVLAHRNTLRVVRARSLRSAASRHRRPHRNMPPRSPRLRVISSRKGACETTALHTDAPRAETRPTGRRVLPRAPAPDLRLPLRACLSQSAVLHPKSSSRFSFHVSLCPTPFVPTSQSHLPSTHHGLRIGSAPPLSSFSLHPLDFSLSWRRHMFLLTFGLSPAHYPRGRKRLFHGRIFRVAVRFPG